MQIDRDMDTGLEVLRSPSPAHSSDSEETEQAKDRYRIVAMRTIRRWRLFVLLKQIRPVCKGPWLLPGVEAKRTWEEYILPLVPQTRHPAVAIAGRQDRRTFFWNLMEEQRRYLLETGQAMTSADLADFVNGRFGHGWYAGGILRGLRRSREGDQRPFSGGW